MYPTGVIQPKPRTDSDAVSLAPTLGPPPSYHERDPNSSPPPDYVFSGLSSPSSPSGASTPRTPGPLAPPTTNDTNDSSAPGQTLTFSPTMDLLSTPSCPEPIYHLTSALTSAVSSLSLQRRVPASSSSAGGAGDCWSDLYDLWTIPIAGLSRTTRACDFRGRRRGTFAHGRITIAHSVKGRTAVVTVFRKPGDAAGTAVMTGRRGAWTFGRTPVADETPDGGLRLRDGVEDRVRDLAVAAVCARRWMGCESVAGTGGMRELRSARLEGLARLGVVRF